MDATEHKLAMLEERLSRYEEELHRTCEKQDKIEKDMHEFHILFERQSGMISSIHNEIVNSKKSTVEWVRWIPGVLIGAVSLVIAFTKI
jgi:uncharacterized coiled-coil DUF342 family protein